MSALIAWTSDDYGDGAKSLEYFGGTIPPEQRLAANQARDVINQNIGSYADYKAARKNSTRASDIIQRRLVTLGLNALIVQWVPAENAKAAEDSFFKINQAASKIDPTECRLLKSRDSAVAIASRAIAGRGTGHKYWQKFDEKCQMQIEKLGKEINQALYDPPIGEGPTKTLDVPVAGRGYSVLPFIFDLVSQVNEIKVSDSTRKNDPLQEDALPEDKEGNDTLKYLTNVHKTIDRITTVDPASLGLHPVIYFYTSSLVFQPAAFFAAVALIKNLKNKGKLNDFTRVRRNFEEFLITYKEFIGQISHNVGSGIRSTKKLLAFYEKILEHLWDGKNEEDILQALRDDKAFSFLSPLRDDEPDNGEKAENIGKGKRLTKKTKTIAFVRDALPLALRCHICDSVLHRNSITFDHIQRVRDGGGSNSANAKSTHPYCNSTYKN